ncbi:TRAP transporter substrate-binding protein DctP [Aquisalimonas lutea]|uniref:TRAP transporter substrate-binding protein n=1 Tax=Aquisalimonas lutea TaxID=1327750 RepID=UPI0025B483BE|nr:TRAP transporter substrate-binding protein DctP [Aquisalimonas lutea]MDN3518589.1 TRAP transporter substrate-binding protein DctP [Aquisalimonas lutea]
MSMKRRDFLKTGAGAAGGAIVGAPALLKAQSDRTFTWRMTNAYPPESPFYVTGPGSPEDFCRKVAAMSGGRLQIEHFAAGELVPAMEGFDAVTSGTVEMNAANAYFWTGQAPAAQYFTTVPFGMNFQGQNAWIYHGGGLELWHELYAGFNAVPFPMGNTGVQMTGWFREPIESVADLDGLNMRIPGLAADVYSRLGVNTQVLPGGEIFPALERGVIDAAEFVGPYQDRRLGLHQAAKYYYTTGWAEPNNVTELLINKDAWESLPEDLQAIVRTAAMACNLESHTWCEANNSDALTDLVDNHGVIADTLPGPVVERLQEATFDVLSDFASQDEQARRIHEAFFAFRKKHASWAALSEGPVQRLVNGSLSASI